MTRHTILLALLVAAPTFSAVGCGDDGGGAATAPPPATIRVATLNLGNGDDTEPNYPYRMRDQAYEDFLTNVVRSWDADIVALQEVLPPHVCEAFEETDPAKTCFDHANRPPAARRILGDGYSIVCDDRLQFECVGVRVGFGTIDGVAPGEMALMGAPTDGLPLPTCSYVERTCDDTRCDEEATVSRATVVADWGRMDIAHLHLNATGLTASGAVYLGGPCREGQVEPVFAGVGSRPTVVLGDFNFDPSSLLYAGETEIWDRFVGAGLRLRDHGALEANGDRVPTQDRGVAIDHVLTNFAEGRCVVADDPVVDAGFDFTQLTDAPSYSGRIDHRAVVCELSWPTAE